MAAVNDIAARELEAAREEQFQSYLNQTPTKTVPNQNQNQINNYNYYSNSHVNNMQPPIYTNASTTKLSQNAKDPSKTLTLATITNDLFPSGCDSSTDEYVDINDLEFIEKNNEEGDSDKSILMRRSQRKKTTKHKDDDCMYFYLIHFYSKHFFILFYILISIFSACGRQNCAKSSVCNITNLVFIL